MFQTLTDFGRRDLQFHTSNVASVLPEHFQELYPELVTFLNKYYEFLDSDQTITFNQDITALLKARDIQESNLQNLNRLLKEIGMDVIPVNYFRDPRYAARLLANFYRVKGSLFSAEGFFKAFFQSDVEVVYPKRNIFIVGESLIGPDDGFIIQDGALYQIFSILIRSDVPIVVWGDLYKMFVHPAGFYLGSEVTFTGVASMMQNPMPIAIEDTAATIVSLLGTAAAAPTATADMTGLSTDPEGTKYRFSFIDTLQPLSEVSITTLAAMYQDNEKLFTMVSHRFDEDSDSNGSSMDFSNTAERFDQVSYPFYDSV